MKHKLPALLGALLLCTLASPAYGQAVRVIEDDDWCERSNRSDNDDVRVCEVREITLSADRDEIDVDAGMNGGVAVYGWEEDEILVRARVTANAPNRDRAEELVDQVEIETGRTIEADGPRVRDERRTWYSVSFQIFAPHQSNLRIETHNGGISIEEIRGNVDFRALNGGVSLVDLGGDVTGRTTNGGLTIELSGSAWDGVGLDVETTNGGVVIEVPDDYSAELESGTVNGSIEVEFPVRVQGRIGRRINATLGDGGQPIRAFTTNGGVLIKRG